MSIKILIPFLAVGALSLTSCDDKKCSAVGVDATGEVSHTHASSTQFKEPTTYEDSLTSPTAGENHSHNVTLSDEHVNNMNEHDRVDVTSSSAKSHTHTVHIECK